MVYEAAHTVEIPVIGIGGITTAEDVVEFMLAGAAAVEVGTANFWDPCATEQIVDGLSRWCVENRVTRNHRPYRDAGSLAAFRHLFAASSIDVNSPCLLPINQGWKSCNKQAVIGFTPCKSILDTHSLSLDEQRFFRAFFKYRRLNTYETQTHAVRFVADVFGGNGFRATAHGR